LIITGLFFIFTIACNSENTNNSGTQDKDSVSVSGTENQIEDIQPDTTEAKQETNANNKLDKAYTAKYICPNHDSNGSDKPGDCPVCGMELIENPNYQGK